MQCTVLLFAQLAETVGERALTIDLADDATVAEAVETLAGRYPAIASMRDQVAVAVDERYARPDEPLHDGCTIALIPPVSGG